MAANAVSKRGQLVQIHPEIPYYSLDNPEIRAVLDPAAPKVYDARTRPWFQTAVKVNSAVWSDIYPSVGLPQLIVSAVLPVYDPSGTLLGVTGVDFSLDDISQFLESLDIGQSGQAFVVDGETQFVQWSQFADQRSIDWRVVVVVPEAEFMEQIAANTRTTILLCLGALGVAIAVGVFTSQRITQPILELTEMSQTLARSSRDQQIGSG